LFKEYQKTIGFYLFAYPADKLYVIFVQVYASNKENTIMASSICGSCEVMSVQKFKDEIDRRTHLTDADSSLHPVFMCRFFFPRNF